MLGFSITILETPIMPVKILIFIDKPKIRKHSFRFLVRENCDAALLKMREVQDMSRDYVQEHLLTEKAKNKTRINTKKCGEINRICFICH